MNNPANHDLTAAFLRHQDELRRFLARRTDCGDTAADLLQEVYLRIAGYPANETVVNQRAFLYRVAGHLLIDHFRRQARHAERDGGPPSEYLVCARPESERILAGRQQWEQAVLRLRALPPRMGEVILLGRVDGKSHRQIAGELKLSPRHVERLMTRGLKQLQVRGTSDYDRTADQL